MGLPAGAAPINASTAAFATSLVVSAGPTRLLRLSGYNAKASAQFIQLYNTVSLPADTAVPVVVLTAAASSNFSLDLGMYGKKFGVGLVVGNSSTGATKTVGSADCWIEVTHVPSSGGVG
jgi:hypothetical protein